MTRAIPHRLDVRLWPFTYDTDAAAVRETVARYDESIAINRECVAVAMRAGRDPTIHRRQIDRLSSAKRNGLAKIRELEA